MFFLLRIAYLWFTVGLLVMAVIALSTVDLNPSIVDVEPLTHHDIARAKQILEGTLSKKQSEAAVNSVSLTRRDLNLVSNYVLTRYGDGAAHVDLSNGEIRWSASLKLPQNPLGRFINLKFRLITLDQNPLIQELSIGRIQIPKEFAPWVVQTVVNYTDLGNFHSLIGDHIEGVHVNNRTLNISYRWNPDTLKQIKTVFANEVNERLLLVYHHRLVKITRQPTLKKHVSLSSLMEPLFKVAYQRSKIRNPVEENRALLLILATYVSGKNLTPLISNPQQLARPQKHSIRLNRRIDTAQHFMASAALAVSSGTALANVVGLYKEVTDSKVGSGFSFIDLAADRAGTRFGDLAIRSSEDARLVQKVMAHNLKDRIYMPNVSDLPESLSEEMFKNRYRSVNSPAYNQMIQNIEQRISRLDLYY